MLCCIEPRVEGEAVGGVSGEEAPADVALKRKKIFFDKNASKKMFLSFTWTLSLAGLGPLVVVESVVSRLKKKT